MKCTQPGSKKTGEKCRHVLSDTVHKETRKTDLEMSVMKKKTIRISHEHKCCCEDSLKGIATPHQNLKPGTTWRHKPITSLHPKPQQSSPTASPPEPFVHPHLPKQNLRACKASRLPLTSPHPPTSSPLPFPSIPLLISPFFLFPSFFLVRYYCLCLFSRFARSC
jgi:hypothetical protein